MAPELSTRDQEFVAKYFKDVGKPPVKMLIQAFSLMLAALVLFVAAAVITGNSETTMRTFKLVMFPGMLLSTAVFIPGFVIYRKWFRSRDLARLHTIFKQLSGTGNAAPEPPAE